MPYYVGDQTKTVLFHTSGTNINTTGAGFWVGAVQEVSLEESEGYFEVRYAGTASRDVQQHVQGPQTYAGTITYYPQDFRMLKYALGSCVDSGSPTPYTHDFIATNNNNGTLEVGGESLPAWNMELSKAALIAGSGVNLVRNVYGCFLNTLTLSASEGELVNAEVEFVARAGSYASGATTAVTEDTNRPFHWADTKWSLLSSGTAATADIKAWTVTISNNLETPNYTDATRIIGTPIPTNRDYGISLTLNANSTTAKSYYDQYFKGGSEFNAILDMTASTGSRSCSLIFSGCRITEMNAPEPREGIQEFELTITPKTMVATEASLTFKYNAE